MKNRKQRYQEKVFKYHEQQRVPECFEDPEDFEDVWDPPFPTPPACWDGDWRYIGYGELQITCGDVYCKHCSRYVNWDDWKSVDSNPNEFIFKRPVKDEEKYASAVVEKHWASRAGINQYAVLDEEEETFLDMVEEKEKFNSFKEDILNDKMVVVEDESDWKVYQRTHAKKNTKRIKIIESEWAAYKQRLADTQKWLDSWHNDETNTIGSLANVDECLIINTDGFFRRNRKAGYGVIIRYASGVPIVASAGVYNQGKPVSALYHELQGINRGFELAIKYGFYHNVIVYCSSYIASDLVGSRFGYYEDGYRYRDYTANDVWNLVKSHDPDCGEKDFRFLMYPLIQEIVENSSMFISFKIYEIKRRQNSAADHLAKLLLKKDEINPPDFPEELKLMVYEDAQGGDLTPGIQRRRPDWFPRFPMW